MRRHIPHNLSERKNKREIRDKRKTSRARASVPEVPRASLSFKKVLNYLDTTLNEDFSALSQSKVIVTAPSLTHKY